MKRFLLLLAFPATAHAAATPPTVEAAMRTCGVTITRSGTLDQIAQQPGVRGNLQTAMQRGGYVYANASSIEATDATSLLTALTSGCRNYAMMQEYGVSQKNGAYVLVLAKPRISPNLTVGLNTELEVMRLTNLARAAGQTCGGTWYAPAPPVSWNQSLANAARGYAQWQAARNTTGHVDPTLGTPGDRAGREGWRGSWGENLAYGPASPDEVVKAWIKSPAHCKNLMNPQHTMMGAGLAINARSEYGTYWGQMFGY